MTNRNHNGIYRQYEISFVRVKRILKIKRFFSNEIVIIVAIFLLSSDIKPKRVNINNYLYVIVTCMLYIKSITVHGMFIRC